MNNIITNRSEQPTHKLLCATTDFDLTSMTINLAKQIDFKTMFVFTSLSNYRRYENIFHCDDLIIKKYHQRICKNISENEDKNSVIQKELKMLMNSLSEIIQPHILIIIDNINDFDYNSTVTRELILCGRQYKISMIFAQSKEIRLKPDLRENIDYLILVGDHSESVLEKFWKFNVNEIIHDKKDFLNLYEVIRKNNLAFVLSNFNKTIQTCSLTN